MSLLQILGRRLLLATLVIFGVIVVTFIISRLIPGDPARLMAGEHASQETVQHMRHTLGLDKPLPEQFFVYLTKLAHGDLGVSIRTERPVSEDIRRFFPATIELSVAALLFAVLTGVPLGVIAAVYKDTWIDQAARALSVIGISMPAFWLGLLLLDLFYNSLGILPGTGRLDEGLSAPPSLTGMFTIDALLTGQWATWRNALAHLALPAFTLGFVNLGIIMRQIRSAMIEVLQEDYIRTARASGLSSATIIVSHALRNAMIPSVTMLGLAFGDLLYGAVLTETIFAWPGMGNYVIQSISFLDFPSIMGFAVIASLAYVLLNLGVDLSYMLLDPQIREVG
jgi:ABC-type dipeptide/oligopeptide/nickel transport system permease component